MIKRLINKFMDKCLQKNKNSKCVITEMLETLSFDLNALSESVALKINRNEADEKMINNLHSDLQKHKNDMYLQIVKPILMDIIEMREGMLNTINFIESESERKNTENETLQVYTKYTNDILSRYGVSSYQSKVGDHFDPSRHKIVETEETKNQEHNHSIARSLSFGYMYNGKPIYLEKVNVFSLTTNKQEA
jgi:molecular chaperone GrpE (heat shock protein)